MPTIQNILHIQGGGAKAAALLDFIADRRYGRGSIDFNRITPMPPWVYRQPTNQELLRQYGEENCSRGWCQQNWGTAQNALSDGPSGTTVEKPSASTPRTAMCGS